MILIVHNGHTVEESYSVKNNTSIPFNSNESIVSVLKNISKKYPDELLLWVKKEYKTLIDFNQISTIFHHKCIMASYSLTGNYCIAHQIGYVEQTPYTNIPRDVKYPTWLMSSDVGGIFAEILNSVINTVPFDSNANYFLISLAKHNMPLGLFCYSNPKLLKQIHAIHSNEEYSEFLLFKFVKQHYKSVWMFNLLLCFSLFEKRFPLLPFLRALFSKRNKKKVYLDPLKYKSIKFPIKNKTLDVIIPTIGRKEQLYNVLQDLQNQTVLPKNVIIVEQNSNENSVSELDYLTTQSWPFKIKISFIHQTGVCNARNLAMSNVESDWCFFSDDDIRFESNLIEESFEIIENLGAEVLNLQCLQPHERQSYFYVNQTDIFGSGTSIVKTSFFNKVAFDTVFEFGFGEDSDFGMQLRKSGADIIYIPTIKITHLKAPIGGFRTKVKQLWEDENVQPKPSPTIMLFLQKNYNVFQLRGYKYNLLVKFYRNQNIKNPCKYFKTMQKKWQRSMYWSEQLKVKQDA